MEQSKQFKCILDLGKRLVKELDLSQSTDTLGRWMTHHVAELIEQTEKANGKDRVRLKEYCRKEILALWQHINVLPQGSNPFSDLQPILLTIRALDPENQAYFYHQQVQEAASDSKLPESAKEWLKLSLGLDHSARLLISVCLRNAEALASEEYSEWISLSENTLDQEFDLPLINVVQKLHSKTEEEQDSEQEAKKAQLRKLEDQQGRLRGMVRMAKLLADELDSKIEKLKSDE